MITKKCVVNIFKRLNYSLINNILLWVIFTLRVHRGLSVGICRFSTHTHIHTRTQRERGTNLGQKDGESPRKAATTIYFTNMLHARAAIPLKSNTPPHHHPTPNAHRPIFPTQRPRKCFCHFGQSNHTAKRREGDGATQHKRAYCSRQRQIERDRAKGDSRQLNNNLNLYNTVAAHTLV